MSDSFKNALMDMDATADDWGQEIGKTLADRIIEQMIVPTMIQPLLQKVQDAFNAAMTAATSTDNEGNAVYDWSKVLGDEALSEAISNMQAQYPEMKELIQKIMSLAGVNMETTFSNSLDNLSDTLLDRLLSLDDGVEDIGKQIGATLIREMLEQLMATKYAEKIATIKQMWQDILTGKDTVHTWQDVVSEIARLEEEMANPEAGLSGLAEEYKRLTATAKEGFSDLRGAFVDSLLDMNADAEGFGKKIGETMLNQMLDAYIDSKYKAQIAKINQEWAEALASGNVSAMEQIRQKVETLYSDISVDEQVLDLANAIKEMNKQLDTTFSDMADSWAESLMGMKDTAEDWAKEVGRTIAKKIITEMVVPTMIQPYLNALQKAMNAALEAENATWQDVIDATLPYVAKITDAYSELQPVVEQIMNSFGIFREEVEEAEEEVEYALQDMKSDFVSSLMDIEATAEERGKSISRALAESFIRDFVLGEAFAAQMKAWQQQYENIRNGGLSEDERRRQIIQLRDAIAAAKEGYVNEARAIQELLGLNNAEDQKATANIADKLTSEQGDMLLGVNMAQEMTLEQILATTRGGLNLSGGATATYGTVAGQEALNAQILSTLQGMQNATSVTGTSSDIFNRLGYTNEYLRAIRDSNDAMLAQFGNILGRIDSKLARL